MMETINHKIIHSLIEEKEFPEVDMEGKMSIKSFESLREFEDSYLNDSEINWMLKRFESVSNLESRLFEWTSSISLKGEVTDFSNNFRVE